MAPKNRPKQKLPQVASASEISRRYGVSRQAVLQWATRHDDFPDPIIKDGLTIKADGVEYRILDDSGKTLYYPLDAVAEWHAKHPWRKRAKASTKPKKAKAKLLTVTKKTRTTTTKRAAPSAVRKKLKKGARASA